MEQTPLDAAAIEAAFLDCELAKLRETGAAVAGAVGELDVIEGLVMERVGAARTPDSRPLRDLLSPMDDLLSTKLAEQAGADEAEPEATVAVDADAPVAVTSNPGDEGGSAVIAGREDVRKTTAERLPLTIDPSWPPKDLS